MENPLLDMLNDVRHDAGLSRPLDLAKLDEAIALVERAKVTDPINGRYIFGPCLVIPLPVPVVATNDDVEDAKAAIEADGSAHVTNSRHLERVALAIAKSRAGRKNN